MLHMNRVNRWWLVNTGKVTYRCRVRRTPRRRSRTQKLMQASSKLLKFISRLLWLKNYVMYTALYPIKPATRLILHDMKRKICPFPLNWPVPKYSSVLVTKVVVLLAITYIKNISKSGVKILFRSKVRAKKPKFDDFFCTCSRQSRSKLVGTPR